MKRNGGGRIDSGDVAKRAKVDSGQNPPSKVLYISSLPSDVSEGEVVQLGLPFGRMTAMILNKKKNQCFLEMADIDIAETMVSYYTERPPKIGQRTVHVRYSNYEHLKMENNAQNAGCIAALKAADQLLDGGGEESKATLRVIIDNMMYPITVEILHKIFSKYGQVLRIVTFTKNNQFHAFVEFGNPIMATAAKNSLSGQNIYNGCCTLRIDYSKLAKLSVKFNNDKMWDFTNPNLPSGDGGNMGGNEGGMRGVGGMMSGADNYGSARRRQGGAQDFDNFEDNFESNAGNGGGYRGEMSRMGSAAGKMSGSSGNMGGMDGNMANRMSGNLGGMGGNMGGMGGNMGSMSGNMGGMSGSMGGMSGNMGGMGGMGGNMNALAQNMLGMGGNMGGILGNMGGMGGNLSGIMGNMGGMAGNMGLLSGNMGGNLGGMLGNMASLGAAMGNMSGGMGGIMGNINSMAGNMGGMGGNMGRMSGNLGNASGIPSLMGNIPGLSGNMGGGMMPGVGGGMGGLGGMNVSSLMGGGMMNDNRGEMGRKGSMDRGNRSGNSERMGRDGGNRRDTGRADRVAGRGDHGEGGGCVIMTSNMDEKRITPDKIFTLFGLYGDVVRVKILFNKKDSALVEYAVPEQAQFAVTHLNRAVWYGKDMRVSRSKHQRIMEAKEGVAEAWLTKDFSNSPLHRFKNPNSKNYNNIYPPSATLHLSNITPDTTQDMLTELFGEFGEVVAFKFFAKDRRMALIQMSSVEDAICALVELHNYELGPRSNLRVSFTQSTIKD